MFRHNNTVLKDNMILSEFSKYLQGNKEKIIRSQTSATKLLCEWINLVINKNPKNNIDKIIHKEILLAKNNADEMLIVGKSESGRVLIKALTNFALSYENYIMSKWLVDKKPHHFNKYSN